MQCSSCGGQFEESEFCPHCGARVVYYDEYIKPQYEPKPKKMPAMFVMNIILTAIVLVMIGVFSGYLSVRNNIKEESVVKETKASVSVTEQPTNTPEPVNTTYETYQPERFIATDVEGEVESIRKSYYSTQNRLSQLNSVKVGKYTCYFNEFDEIERVDFKFGNSGYDASFYYRNGDLYFAFIFKGTIENRIYVYKNTVCRWIDENGVIHDNEFSNSQYEAWSNRVFEEDKIFNETVR